MINLVAACPLEGDKPPQMRSCHRKKSGEEIDYFFHSFEDGVKK
jgi:hypothetical protein